MATPLFRHPMQFVRLRSQTRRRVAPFIVISLAGCSLVHTALAAGVLPLGGQYVAGTGTIANQGNALLVTQPGSTRGVINWNSFSIGDGNTVTFDNGSGATLNRVTGGSPSAILGNLNATGSVYLINPQGVLVGHNGVISTGGRFVASTLDLPDSAFVTGGTLTLTGFSNGKIVNLGKISSSGGDVFLISHDLVVNAGSVSARNGTAEYAAGQQVVLYESSSNRQVFVQIASHGNVIDRGTTEAAQINLEAADGNIYALAGSGSRIRATGTATRGGHIWLVADNGNVTQGGTIAATNADGTGGTVDTLANALTLKSDAAVQAGLWNVSTPNITVDSATAGAFMRSLNAGTSVDATATGTNGASGDLNVPSNLNWMGPASLALVAFHNVTVASSATLKNTGSGNLSVRADSASLDNGGSVANQGAINWSNSTGIVSLLYDMNGSYSPGTILANSAWTASPFSGYVTQVTGYKLVNSLTDLQNVSLDLAGTYALGKDIDASPTLSRIGGPSPDVAFIPLGSAATPFTGQFDGMGHVIDSFGENMDYSPADIKPVGLFGEIGVAGVVRNVGMTNSTLYDPDEDIINNQPIVVTFGILAGRNRGLITNSYTTGFRGTPHYGNAPGGGLVGTNDGLIERSWSSAGVGDAGDVGGLVGANFGTILQSFVTGAVATSNFGLPGGLVADNYGTISQSYAAGSTMGDLSAGGLVYSNTGVIEQSFVSGPVSGYCCSPPGTATQFGGIAAVDNGTTASNVYWDTQATLQPNSAGTGTRLPAANGFTTAQMSTASSFDASWDFSPTGAWVMLPGLSHPLLRWQLGQ